MRDLSIRKVPGVGRVNERLLESIGIKVSCLLVNGSNFCQLSRLAGISMYTEPRYLLWINTSVYIFCFRHTWVLHRILLNRDDAKKGRVSVLRGQQL